MSPKSPSQKNTLTKRPPVVAVMGHIDHGKSTLLDYIRKTNLTEKETGGITQHIAAYEVTHTTPEKVKEKITFLDTPGHEAFAAIRQRGANVADIAILVVSAEDGVKPQTLEALKFINECKTPYIVALTKIDKPQANIERAKQSLLENEIYIEGYGGSVPCVSLSSKTGEGVNDLMDMILLVRDLEELTGDPSKKAEGYVIEAYLDKAKGISASLLIKDGGLKKGMCIVAGDALSPVRIMEDFLGKKIEDSHFSSPVRVVGWSDLPKVGSPFHTCDSKKEAEAAVAEAKAAPRTKTSTSEEEGLSIPIVLKGDASGSLEAIEHEIKKLDQSVVKIKIMNAGIGNITETDLKTAAAGADAIIFGFNVKIDSVAKSVIERGGLSVELYNIIYELIDRVRALIALKTPKIQVEEVTGKAKILRSFSRTKDRQILGGKVLEGIIRTGDEVRILRRESEIGRGKVRELQHQKVKETEVLKDFEFGMSLESKIELAPGDRIEAYTLMEK